MANRSWLHKAAHFGLVGHSDIGPLEEARSEQLVSIYLSSVLHCILI